MEGGSEESAHAKGTRSNRDVSVDVTKRAAARRLIERYFYQLTNGCGDPGCDNEHCASSGELGNLTPDQAAAQALQLFSQEARLCATKRPTSASRNSPTSEPKRPTSDNDSVVENALTEATLISVIESCGKAGSFAPLVRVLGESFSNIDVLARSFRKEIRSPVDALLEKTPGDLTCLRKEDVRALDSERDEDEREQPPTPGNVPRVFGPLDVLQVRACYRLLSGLPGAPHETALVNALTALAGSIQLEVARRGPNASNEDILDALQVAFELGALGTGDFLETALPALCKAAAQLPLLSQAQLARRWASADPPSIRQLVENLQQLITLVVIVTQFHREFCVQDDLVITAATKLMKVVYFANLLTGTRDPSDSDDESISERTLRCTRDPLAIELQIDPLDVREPIMPVTEFYNEPLSDAVEMDRDFANFRSESFSFMRYPFILTPATKTLGMYFDSRIKMISERRISLLQTVAGQLSNPYLRLRVRRDHIIDDALVELEMMAMENPSDLKKQLVVEFIGEQGIDEGGVSKEFFQLIIEEILNPDYGMFTPANPHVWFNANSFESDDQFTLVGIMLGLAIYNNIILAVDFPMVVYRKLVGKRGSFEDLLDFSPTLYRSMKSLLDYEGDDMEDVFMQTFRVCHQDAFGTLTHHDLLPDGDKVLVSQANKYEFVRLYSDFLLNKSIEKQFNAFRRGFHMVTDESPLSLLFRPEEIELLVCGSRNFDFDELELATQYDGGYTTESRIIKDFWRVVHSLNIEDKRKLLQFTTGSDRVPLGGLSRLRLVIARNGSDTDRLPTSHTCFNVLLLPEYTSEEKLRDRLLKAINYSKGFGMI